MSFFVCLNPFNWAEWWEINGNTRRLIDSGQKYVLSANGVSPTALPTGWFLAYPIASG